MKPITFTRRGDFYEYRGDDAKAVASIIGMTLVQDSDGTPSVGCPAHALHYLDALSAAGYVVTLVDRNVAMILNEGVRIVRGVVPQAVRAELRMAVKAGVLGHLKKNGLLPEIFYAPDKEAEAIDRQRAEGLHAVGCIAKV